MKPNLIFIDGLISILNEMKLNLVCEGYWRSSSVDKIFESSEEYPNYHAFEQNVLLGMCFFNFQPTMKEKNRLWFYHIENDESKFQNRVFQEFCQNSQWEESITGHKNISININSVADVSFYKKGSIYGAIPDCIAYLSHLEWKKNRDFCLSPFKLKLVEIFGKLDPSLISKNYHRSLEGGSRNESVS